MLYIIQKYCYMSGHNVFDSAYEVESKNAYDEYKMFMLKKASELNIVVNQHWLNIMCYKPNNEHLTKQDYNRKQKQWKKIKKEFSFENFIINNLDGVKVEYNIIYL